MSALEVHHNDPTIYVRLVWQGPYTYGELYNSWYDANDNEIKRKLSLSGIYQTYGTHHVYGPESLLYIGKSKNVLERVVSDYHWDGIEEISSPVKIYFGFLFDEDEKWVLEKSKLGKDALLETIEGVLIQYCTPAFNSCKITGKSTDKIDKKFHVLNYGRHHRIPFEVSNLWDMLHPKHKQKDWYNEFKPFW